MESTPPRLAIPLAKILRVKDSFCKLAAMRRALLLETLSSCYNGIVTPSCCATGVVCAALVIADPFAVVGVFAPLITPTVSLWQALGAIQARPAAAAEVAKIQK